MSKQQVLLKLARVKCLDETGGSNVERFGNDEIQMAGIGMDASGNTVRVDPFEVYAHFDDGETKTYAPERTIFTLDVPSVGGFPKTCGACLLIAEKDNGGFAAVVQSAHVKIDEEIQRQKQSMVPSGGGTIAAVAVWPIISAVWAVVGPKVTE